MNEDAPSIPMVSVVGASPLPRERVDAETQKDETLSSTSSTIDDSPPDFRILPPGAPQPAPPRHHPPPQQMQKKKSPAMPRRGKIPVAKTPSRVGMSKSQSPPRMPLRRASRPPAQLYIKTTPAIPMNANIRHILENVAHTEGPFEAPFDAVREALLALQDDGK